MLIKINLGQEIVDFVDLVPAGIELSGLQKDIFRNRSKTQVGRTEPIIIGCVLRIGVLLIVGNQRLEAIHRTGVISLLEIFSGFLVLTPEVLCKRRSRQNQEDQNETNTNPIPQT